MFRAGECLLVQYNVGGPILLHARIVVAPNPNLPSAAYVLTPDDDSYVEDYVLGPDYLAVHRLPHHGAYPAGIGAGQVYEFAQLPNAARRIQLAGDAYTEFGVDPPAGAVSWVVEEGPAAAAVAAAPPPAVAGVPGGVAALVAALGLPPAGAAAGVLGAPPPPGPAAPPAAPAAGVAAVPPGPPAPGVLGAPPPAAAIVPAAAAVPAVPVLPAPVAPAAAVPGIDVRVCVPAYDMLGKRHRECRDCIHLLHESQFADWPIPGPRTVLWVVTFMVQVGGSINGWFTKFKSDLSLSYSDEGVEELERNCKQLQAWLTYDQCNIANLASAELLCRAIQVICVSYSERLQTSREDSFERGILFGVELDGLLPICPALKEHLASELQKRNSIEKEKRRAQELRLAMGPGRGGRNNRRGRGGADKDAPVKDG